MSNRYRGRIDAFVTLHTYSQIWIHPYGHRKDTYPGDVQDLVQFNSQYTYHLLDSHRNLFVFKGNNSYLLNLEYLLEKLKDIKTTRANIVSFSHY
ncbi:unnamed protein product [Gongylonema pulchrum]|uniref:Peptidase_M14 domain-containing protein n=1 Tax=Gongylonema pulchrum TaxID=637853 RepID=A0A183DJV1_9BILA|nr:unnamed protein product [Gongylonema pulchrum]